MKNLNLLLVISLLLIGANLLYAADGRKEIDKFLKSYEEYVVAYEKAAKKSDLTTLTKLQVKNLEMIDKLSKIQNTKAWTTADTLRYNELTLRLSKAMENQQKSSAPAGSGMYNFSF